MEFDEFIREVKRKGVLDNRDEVIKAIRVTLQTLKERLVGDEPRHIASQLPRQIGEMLQEDGKGEKFTVEEFFSRVSRREGTEIPVAMLHSRAVLEVIKDAITAGEMQDVRAQLPVEFYDLFEEEK
ncbi:MAG TPA: DUF2267 domain-containing protein [Ignavibacteriales bacterium]|nr:DUF2267 domain-containing protein [Ignavibacteriales bacterium]